MLTMRPLPATTYTGPVCTPHRPLAVPPQSAVAWLSTHTASPTRPLNPILKRPILKRRSHTRRLQSAPSADLPPVNEEEETELAYQEPIVKPKKKSRPTPLIPPRTYASPSLPLVVEIPECADTFDLPMKDESESFPLSPSMLLARRRSETILDFPLPPSHSPSVPTSLLAPTESSPTFSDISLTSTSSAASSPIPLTPYQEDDVQPHPEKIEVNAEPWTDERLLRHPYRSSSVVSLRSFSMAEFDSQPEGIYAMPHPRYEPRPPEVPRKETVNAPRARHSPRLVLSVLDTASGGSFDVPLVLGSFLSLPSSPSMSESFFADSDCDSDGEGIPDSSWWDCEGDDFGSALLSSEDDASDSERGPSYSLDPGFRAKPRRHRRSRDGSKTLPPLPVLNSVDESPDTPSVYSQASAVDWNRERLPPRESIAPSDVPHVPYPPPTAPSPRPPSSFCPPRPESPVLRSRFSSSTLDSLPPQPTSSTQTFFSRLTGRVKPPSPTKGERSSASRASPRRRPIIPASPAPSAFSFSTSSRTSSRSSLDSADGSSVFSEDSTGSAGLRRPPIPIELFLRG